MLFAEAKTHKFERLLYGEPLPPQLVDGIPVGQHSTEIAWLNCIEKMRMQADVVFYGNSITRNSDFRQFFPKISIANLGLGGDDLNGLLRRIPMVQAFKPKKVFLMGGINGSKSMPIDTFAVRYEHVVRALRDSLPETGFFLQSILPVNHSVYDCYADNEKIRKMNDEIRLIATLTGSTYIDLYSEYIDDNGELPMIDTDDGIHIKPESYDRWAKAIEAYIIEK